LGLPIYLERWGIFYIDIASIVFGVVAFIKLRQNKLLYKHLLWAVGLYILLNFLSVLCNVFGRVVLTNVLHFTAVYAFAQVIALTIWARVVVEAVLLQITSSRARKNYPEDFEYAPIQKGLSKMSAIIAIIIWLIYFTDNLNVFDILLTSLSAFLAQPRAIGSFSFTVGGVCLFLGIILIANFLQKYIGYLFGDTGEDFLVENKKERSRLLITRLILLIVGFLLAVAASGLPVDRITIILGALSVGIGLGLQNIVNNFVSGVILVFDRTLRIGDVVEVSDKKGRVKEIGLRASKLITGDGAEIIIPNGDVLSHNIINWTLSNNHVRLNMSFTVAKPYNIEEISRICNEELNLHKNVLKENAPAIVVTSITAGFATVKIYFWCNNISQTETTYSQLNEAIYNRFEAAGIKIL
jgi:Small-conductance mechanosensitive channel